MLYLVWVINMTTYVNQNLSHAEIVEEPIVKIYHDLLSLRISRYHEEHGQMIEMWLF